jgi:hypothetical protein
VAEADDGTLVIRLAKRVPAAESWGLRFFPDPTRPGGAVPIFWRSTIYRGALSARVLGPDSDTASSFRLAEIPGRKAVLIAEHCRGKLAVEDASFAALIAFDGALAAPPEALTLAVEHGGLADLDARLRALQAFIEHCQRRYRPAPPERGFAPQRLKDALVALDARLAGASLRQIAELLMGADIVVQDWDNGSRFSRERARRAVNRGVALMEGGWRDLLA